MLNLNREAETTFEAISTAIEDVRKAIPHSKLIKIEKKFQESTKDVKEAMEAFNKFMKKYHNALNELSK